MSGSDTNDGLGREEQTSRDEHGAGHSGEGAASAMAHMISQGQRQRHQQPEADDHPGSQAS